MTTCVLDCSSVVVRKEEVDGVRMSVTSNGIHQLHNTYIHTSGDETLFSMQIKNLFPLQLQ